MEEAFETVVLETGDMGELTAKDVACTNCLEGYCPARRTASLEGEELILCGAKKTSCSVLAAYQQRTGRVLLIERPC